MPFDLMATGASGQPSGLPVAGFASPPSTDENVELFHDLVDAQFAADAAPSTSLDATGAASDGSLESSAPADATSFNRRVLIVDSHAAVRTAIAGSWRWTTPPADTSAGDPLAAVPGSEAPSTASSAGEAPVDVLPAADGLPGADPSLVPPASAATSEPAIDREPLQAPGRPVRKDGSLPAAERGDRPPVAGPDLLGLLVPVLPSPNPGPAAPDAGARDHADDSEATAVGVVASGIRSSSIEARADLAAGRLTRLPVGAESAVPDAPSDAEGLPPVVPGAPPEQRPDTSTRLEGTKHNSAFPARETMGDEALRQSAAAGELPDTFKGAAAPAADRAKNDQAQRTASTLSTAAPLPSAAPPLPSFDTAPTGASVDGVGGTAWAREAGAPADGRSDARDQDNASRSTERPSAIAVRLAHAVQMMTGFDSALVAAAPASLAGTSGAPVADQPNAMSSIVQAMRLQYHSGGGSAVVNLEPEFLGGVTVSLHVSRGSVTATVQADRPDVRAWLEANESTLRQGLAEQGLTLDRLIVADERAAAQSNPDGRRQSQQQSRQQPGPATRRDESNTFEVVV